MIVCAAALIVMRSSRRRFLELAARERMTHTLMVPAMYNLCLLDQAFEHGDYSAWRVGSYGGAPMPPATIARSRRSSRTSKLMNAYGATETASPATIMPSVEPALQPDSVGCASPAPISGSWTMPAAKCRDGRKASCGSAARWW